MRLLEPEKAPGALDLEPRFDDLLELVTCDLDWVQIAKPIVRTHSVESTHLRGDDRPDINEVLDSLEWDTSEDDLPESLILVDDVITTGTSFMACKRLVTENAPDVEIIGVFWARTVWDRIDPADFFDDEEDD